MRDVWRICGFHRQITLKLYMVTVQVNIVDKKLQEINSDYEAKRFKDITLQQLEIVPARHGLFHDWLKQCGKLGGQHKFPRLSNSRESIDQLLVLNRQH